MSSLPFPVVPAGPVNSPTWRKGAEREREREEKGSGRIAGVTEAGGAGGRLQAIWVREEAEEMSRRGYSSRTEGWGSRKERSEWEKERKAVSG